MIKHWDAAPDILNAEELASLIGANKQWVYKLAREGELPKANGLGRLTRFNKNQVRAILEGHDSLKTKETLRNSSDSKLKELRCL